jgi:hypothetical protein
MALTLEDVKCYPSLNFRFQNIQKINYKIKKITKPKDIQINLPLKELSYIDKNNIIYNCVVHINVIH